MGSPDLSQRSCSLLSALSSSAKISPSVYALQDVSFQPWILAAGTDQEPQGCWEGAAGAAQKGEVFSCWIAGLWDNMIFDCML